MGMGGNGNRSDGKNGNENGVLEWEWMGIYGNGDDSMGVGREWEQESHSRTPLVYMYFMAFLGMLMANQPLLRNWPRKLPNSAK